MADLLQGCGRNEMANQLLVVIMLTIHCVTYIYIQISLSVRCLLRNIRRPSALRTKTSAVYIQVVTCAFYGLRDQVANDLEIFSTVCLIRRCIYVKTYSSIICICIAMYSVYDFH